MKALFLALLLADLLFFAWIQWHVPTPRPPRAPMPELAQAQRQISPPPAVTPVAHSARCQSIGPFHDLAEATGAAAGLREIGREPRTRVAEGHLWAGLWVYLEDLPSRAEARSVLAVLEEHGITDAYIMPAVGSTYDISLGIFMETPRAQRRAAQARSLGFHPTILERTRMGTVYWLDVELPPEASDLDPTEITGEGDGSGRIVRLEVTPCPPDASQIH